MALWGDARLLFCTIVITCCCCTVTVAQIPTDCCLKVTNKRVEKPFIVDYHRQISGNGCKLSAIILVTRQNVKLCMPADEPWVELVVTHVDRLKKHCKTINYKGKRCNGVRNGE